MNKLFQFDWNGPGFFGVKLVKAARRISGLRISGVLAQAFNRRMVDGSAWGAGLLQIGRRHLAYVGSAGVCIGFMWLLGRAP